MNCILYQKAIFYAILRPVFLPSEVNEQHRNIGGGYAADPRGLSEIGGPLIAEFFPTLI